MHFQKTQENSSALTLYPLLFRYLRTLFAGEVVCGQLQMEGPSEGRG